MTVEAVVAPALTFDRVSCLFPSAQRGKPPHVVLKDASLQVGAAEFVSIVGPTGCGKSTFLNLAAGLLRPTTGTIQSFGAPLAGINPGAGYMFQADALMPWRTALGNTVTGLEYRGMKKDALREIGEFWLQRVGLSDFGHYYPHQLSGGMRKRVALAQTLARDPDLILMDEPFSALDIQTRQLMENEVLDIWQQRPIAVLFITHDLDEAIALGDRVVILGAGPGTSPIAEFTIDLPRPRDVAEIRGEPRFVELHAQIWSVLREEVLKGYSSRKTSVAH